VNSEKMLAFAGKLPIIRDTFGGDELPFIRSFGTAKHYWPFFAFGGGGRQSLAFNIWRTVKG
jgi:hypothetical protein